MLTQHYLFLLDCYNVIWHITNKLPGQGKGGIISKARRSTPVIASFIAQIFFVLAGNAQTTKAATDSYCIQHLGEEDGLQNSIYSILPDQDDFLWIATSNGLSRFDGNKLLPVLTDLHAYTSEFSNVASIHYKSNDTIIAGSNLLKKVAFIVNGRVVKIENQKLEEHGLMFWNQKYTIRPPAYINGNYDTSAFGERVKWKTYDYIFIGGIYNKDTIWLAANNAIWFYDNKGLVKRITVPGIKPDQATAAGGYILYLDKDKYLYYFSPAGLVKKEPLNIPGRKKLTLVNNRFGDAFYCIADSSLYSVYMSSRGKLNFRELIADLRSPSDISVIWEKDPYTIITGTSRHGLYIYRKNLFKVSSPLPGELSNAFFTQQLLPDNQTILAGNGYLFKNGIDYSKQIKGFDQIYFGIFKDSKAWYWYPIPGHMLRTREIGLAPDTIKDFSGRFIEILLEDNAGRIWITSEFEFGYFQNGQYTAVKVNELAGRRINCMKQDITGKYYIGTVLGLYTLDNITQPIAKEIQEFKSVRIRNIIPEADGSVWIFTYGSGFFLISKDGIISFSQNNNKFNFIHSIITDAEGNCWLPSDNGLFVSTRKSLIDYSKNKVGAPFFYMFSIKNGLRTNEFNGFTESSYLRLPNGDISIVSMDGLVHISPSGIHISFSTSPIVINQVLLDSVDIEKIDGFEAGSRTKNIHFSISSSYWGNKENNQLEYQVKIKNDATEKSQWLQIDQSGNINLFAPIHGAYQLIIRKRTGFGPSDYLYKTISFYVLPKWYQTTIFYAAVTIVILFIMIGIFVWRRNYYRRANNILKEKVDRATLELKEMNNSLEGKVIERTKAIQEAERKFRTLVEKSLIGVYIVQDGKFMYVNPKFEELLGYKTSELWGVDGLAVVKKTEHSIVNEKVRRRISGEVESEHYEVTGIKKDGTERHLEFFGSRTIYEGKPTIIGTMLDITDKKQLEKQLLEQKIQEQKKVTRAILAGEEKERNKIAQELHDNINQMLAGIKLYLSMADQQNGSGVIIKRSMQLLEDAIEEIRVLTKEKASPVKKDNLRELLQALVDRLNETTNIKTDLIYAGHTRKMEEELKLNIYRIIQELLNNTLKHAQASNISILVETLENNIRVVVMDNGKGFEIDKRKNGIGIANMINRVESFNGTMLIKSSPGKGCQTELNLPLQNNAVNQIVAVPMSVTGSINYYDGSR